MLRKDLVEDRILTEIHSLVGHGKVGMGLMSNSVWVWLCLTPLLCNRGKRTSTIFASCREIFFP